MTSLVMFCSAEQWSSVEPCFSSGLTSFESLVAMVRSNRKACGLPALERPVALEMAIDSIGGDGFYRETLPTMCRIAARLPHLVSELPLLRSGLPKILELTREQVFCILSAAFLGAVPPQPDEGASRQKFDFRHMQEEDLEKCKCILLYFAQAAPLAEARFRDEKVSYERLCKGKDAPEWQSSFWRDCTLSLCPVQVEVDGSIEDRVNSLQADFAYELIGGGILCGGNVQEEIRFTVCPELIPAMLFCEGMSETDAIIIVGAQFFCKYTGYGRSFMCAGAALAEDTAVLDLQGRRDIQLTAFDALMSPGRFQFSEDGMIRELVKALIAFGGDSYEVVTSETHGKRSVSTGNWGCGVCGCDPELKFLQQWMACTVSGRGLVYYPRENLEKVQQAIEQWSTSSVAQLWNSLRQPGST